MQWLYVNPDTVNGPSRALTLGCGWLPTVPPQFASVAAAPCVILSGAGQTVVVSDSPPTTAGTVTTAAAPIVSAEAAAATAQAALAANQATIQVNAAAHPPAFITYLGVAVPSVAQTTAQLAALTRAVNALIYLVTQQYGTTNGT